MLHIKIIPPHLLSFPITGGMGVSTDALGPPEADTGWASYPSPEEGDLDVQLEEIINLIDDLNSSIGPKKCQC